jgi:hypothetical protein
MFGRKRRGDQADALVPETSYWATHPDPASAPTITPSAAVPAAPSTTPSTPARTSLTVNGQPIDIGSPEGHRVITVLAQQGKLTESHVIQTTAAATPAQQKQITDLLLQRKAGALSDLDFAAAVMRVMKPA